MDQHQHDIIVAPTELPKPLQEQPALESGPDTMQQASEMAGAIALERGVPSAGSPAAAQPMTSPQALSVGTPIAQSPVQSDNVAITGMPAIADDADLIEKEWVAKAKEIVERTKDDPFIQNKEMNKIKADYIKKRYNKDIKVIQE